MSLTPGNVEPIDVPKGNIPFELTLCVFYKGNDFIFGHMQFVPIIAAYKVIEYKILNNTPLEHYTHFRYILNADGGFLNVKPVSYL